MTDDSLSSDAELLERYAVYGVSSLSDPNVVTFVAANPELVQRMERVLAAHRARIAPQQGASPITTRSTPGTPHVNALPSPVVPAHQISEQPQVQRRKGWGRMREWSTRPLQQWTGYAIAAAVAGLVWLVATRTGPAPSLSQRMYTTTVGQRATLTLTDGTHITLAPGTTLRVASFGQSTRTVTLDGEAYFEVAHVAGTPFRVIAGGTTTNVLGTAFMVRHYANEPQVRVAVTAGKVSVIAHSARRPSVLLTAGLVGVLTDSSAVTARPDDMTPYTGWLNERLVFYNAPAPEVLDALSRWYGYQFRFTDSALVRRHLTAGVSTTSSEKALSTLKLLLHVDLQFDGSIVTLVPQRRVQMHERNDLNSMMNRRESEVGR